jgi:hypothetical protein
MRHPNPIKANLPQLQTLFFYTCRLPLLLPGPIPGILSPYNPSNNGNYQIIPINIQLLSAFEAHLLHPPFYMNLSISTPFPMVRILDFR